MPKILILEDSQRNGALFREQLQGEPVEVAIAETAAEAREFFGRGRFDIIALDGIVPSEPGRKPSLMGPILAREFRKKGYRGPLIAISSDFESQQLMKRAGCSHVCEKIRLHGLVRELLGIYSVPPK